ncbi:helix-turn-helix domain-containing protein [Emticicia agri]|uniref:DNA-binding protein n=1 Tax=Emticicia agri TaxID=2492393 RepID=A0A4Q5LVI1_9BACT|nr:helix-turn-helix domain-containing protein [Emticicia agri]RYU93751.1 DNA-binding protein [Emticicia agri]
MNLIITTPEELEKLIQEAIKKISATFTPQPIQVENKPMTIEEASKFLQIPKNTLYKYTHERSIPFRKIGRSLRFNQKDLVEWLEENRKLTKFETENRALSEFSKPKRK